MEFNQDHVQLGIQGSTELTASSIDSNNSTNRSQCEILNPGPAKESTDENIETGIGVSVIVELIDIPMDVVGFVIGRNGTQINSIQSQTGCRVQMAGPSPRMPGYRQVTLQGAKNQIERAKFLINNVIASRFGFEKNNNGYSSRLNSLTGNSEVVSANVLIPKENCGSLVGKGGENIKSLQEHLGVKLGLIQNTKEPTGPKPLQITGYPDQVANAQRYIVENFVMKIAQNDQGSGNYLKNNYNATKTTVQIIVPRETVGRIIGKNGQTIKGISLSSGAKVQFNLDEDQDGPERTVIIQGSLNQVNHAAELVRDFCQSYQNGINVGHFVNSDYQLRVPGASGSFTSNIYAQSGGDSSLYEQVLNTQQLATYQAQPSYASIFQNTQPQTCTNYTPQLQQYLSQQHQMTAVQAQPTIQMPTLDLYQCQTQQIQKASSHMGKAQPQPDYSAQWVKFYRDLGMYEQANLLEQKIKDHQTKFEGNHQLLGQNAIL